MWSESQLVLPERVCAARMKHCRAPKQNRLARPIPCERRFDGGGLAEHEMQRRIIGLHGGNVRFGRAHRIADC